MILKSTRLVKGIGLSKVARVVAAKDLEPGICSRKIAAALGALRYRIRPLSRAIPVQLAVFAVRF